MLININQIIEKINRYKGESFVDDATQEYINKNEVGFYTSHNYVRFISTKRHAINYDWNFHFKEIIAIALGEGLIIDDDEQFIIFFIKEKKPIYFFVPHITSEENKGFAKFIISLKDYSGLDFINFRQDKVVFTYPNNISGEYVYQKWNESVGSFIYSLLIKIGLLYLSRGIMRKEMKQKLNIK